MSIRKNLVSNFILTASSILLPLVTFPYITRILSNSGLGKVFFVDAFTQYFIIFSAIGIPYYGIREIAKVKHNKEATSKLVIELVTLQFFLSVIFVAIFWVLQYFVKALQTDIPLIKIGCITIIANSFLIEWFYQGTENFTFITIRSLAIKFASVICILLLVKTSEDYNIYYLILALLVCLNALLNFIYFLNKYYLKSGVKLEIKSHFYPLLILFSINISVSIYTVLDTIILGILTNPLSVSYYTVPLRLVKMFWMVVGGIGTVLIPRIATLFVNKDQDGIVLLMKKSFSLVFLLTIPFCFFCLTYAHEILFIISGKKYLDAANTLKILSIVPLIIGVCNVLGTQFLLPIGGEKKILYATIAGLIISLTLNFLLIPFLQHLGAAIACVFAEITVCVYILISAKKHISIQIDKSLLYQIFLSLFLSALVGYILKVYLQNIILLLAVFSTYVFAFFLLQFFAFKNQFVFSLIKIKKV